MKGRVFFKKNTDMLFTAHKDTATQVCEALGLELISEKAIILVQKNEILWIRVRDAQYTSAWGLCEGKFK